MRTIEEIATDLAEGLEPWIGHDEACGCVQGPSVRGHALSLTNASLHRPMCGGCSCGLRDALMAEAIGSIATDEEVLAYVNENGEGADILAAQAREILRRAWQTWKNRGQPHA